MNKQHIFCKFYGILLFLAIAAGCASAESPGALPRPKSYVSDFAGVIDEASKQSLEELCRQTFEQSHATIEVVTIKSLDGLEIEDFTTQLEDNWKVGPKGSDKGIVMVFAIKEHKRRIEVGYGLEGILNDAKVGDIGRSMVPQLKLSEYGPGILSGAQQIADVIAADAGNTSDAPAQPVGESALSKPKDDTSAGAWIAFGIVVCFGLVFIIRYIRQTSGVSRGKSSTGTFLGASSGDSSSYGSSSSDSSSSSSDFDSGFGGDSGGGGSSGDW